jgi:Neurotransmitter-gated ion-channel ligand binding domain
MKQLFLFIRSLSIIAGFLILLLASPAHSEEPLEVGIALKVHQITSIDQKSENFSVVATLRMEWLTPELAAEPGEDIPPQRIYKAEDFIKFVTEKQLLWPVHSFSNLQGRIDYQNRVIGIDPKGQVTYLARFTGTFQAPDFDFQHFPLDSQNFFIGLDSLIPQRLIQYKPIQEYSGLGNTLGEEEWILENEKIEVATHDTFGVAAPRLILSFQGERHLVYYIVRILIPVVIIILVSWFTFFLKDYGKRIDLASGNLLLFIAFNFTIANDLPRLGYVTLMDSFMMATFAITGFVVLLNVWMKRLQRHGREQYLEKLDVIGVWFYPLLYVGGGVLMFVLFYN